MHVMIVACYHPLLSSPAFACMLHFDLVSMLFGTSIPPSFNILVKMCLHFFHWFLLSVATRINLLTLVQSSNSLAVLVYLIFGTATLVFTLVSLVFHCM